VGIGEGPLVDALVDALVEALGDREEIDVEEAR
jgi:hypothetical protein